MKTEIKKNEGIWWKKKNSERKLEELKQQKCKKRIKRDKDRKKENWRKCRLYKKEREFKFRNQERKKKEMYE